MKVKVQLDRRYAEPEAAIYTAAMTGEVQQAVRLLSEESPQMLACCDGESVVLVEQTQLVREKSLRPDHTGRISAAPAAV